MLYVKGSLGIKAVFLWVSSLVWKQRCYPLRIEVEDIVVCSNVALSVLPDGC